MSPHDLSVIGFDNQSIVADAIYPGLTTMALPYYEMGALAVKALIEHVRDGVPLERGSFALPSSLIRRDSVAPPAS